MPTILDQSLGDLLDVSSESETISPSVEAFVTRVAGLALELAQGAPPASLVRALGAVTNAGFVSAFAELLMFEGPRSNDRLQSLLRGRVALAELVESTGGMWSAAEAEKYLGRTRATLQNWRDQRRVIALRQGDGSYKYPVVQFAPAPTDLEPPAPLLGLSEVLTTAGDALTPEELVAVLASPQEMLTAADGRPRTGFEALAAGDADRVVALLRHVVTPADDGAPEVAEVSATSAVAAVSPPPTDVSPPAAQVRSR